MEGLPHEVLPVVALDRRGPQVDRHEEVEELRGRSFPGQQYREAAMVEVLDVAGKTLANRGIHEALD